MEKIKVVQNCLKWRENWSTIIFDIKTPPRSKMRKKIKLFQIAWNGETISRKCFFIFSPPPPLEKNGQKWKKIKADLTWRWPQRKTISQEVGHTRGPTHKKLSLWEDKLKVRWQKCLIFLLIPTRVSQKPSGDYSIRIRTAQGILYIDPNSTQKQSTSKSVTELGPAQPQLVLLCNVWTIITTVSDNRAFELGAKLAVSERDGAGHARRYILYFHLFVIDPPAKHTSKWQVFFLVCFWQSCFIYASYLRW